MVVRIVIPAFVLLAAAMQPRVAAAQAGFLEEVIVTAEKRETPLQDTPIAVSAFTQDELERGLINNNMDIQLSVPNMLMSRGFFTTAQINIRGIGNLAVGPAADAGTGVHFNGVYLNNSRIFESEYFDTERVEVLRGPQGTLYGRNTTAGVINVISRKPEAESGGFVDASYGDYDYIRIRGALNIPLADGLWQRFSVFHASRDGFVDNVHTGDDIDDRDMYAVRSSTRWIVGEDTEAHLTIQYFEEEDKRMRGSSNFCAPDPDGILGCLPNRGKPTTGSAHTAGTVSGLLKAVVSGVTRQPFPANDAEGAFRPSDIREVNFDFTPRYETEETIVSLAIDHDFDGFLFHSLTGYHAAGIDARNDYDMTVNTQEWPIATTYQRGPDGPSTVNYLQQSDRSFADPEQWSQEFRLSSDFDGDWNFMAGAFWLDYENDNHYYVYSSALSLFGQTLNIPEEQWLFDNHTADFRLETWALFGEIYYDVSDDLELTLGIRYTDEAKESEQRSIYLNFLDDPNSENGGYTPFEEDSQEFTGKINLNYHLSDDIMFYGTAARSYKGGGFNPISSESDLLNPELGGDPDLAIFKPEFVNSIEVGAKTRLANNTLQANVAFFYYDYADLQVSKIVAQTAINENTDAEVMGFEGEFVYAPDEHLNLVWNLSWLDTELGSLETFDPADPNQIGTTEGIVSTGNGNTYLPCACPGIEVDIEGGELPNAPRFTSFLALRYGWYLNNGMRLDLSTSYYYQDEFYSRVFNTPDDELESWDVWNAGVNLSAADETWYGELWIRNINDDDHWTGQYLQDAAVGLYRTVQLLEPRTYGVSLGYRF